MVVHRTGSWLCSMQATSWQGTLDMHMGGYRLTLLMSQCTPALLAQVFVPEGALPEEVQVGVGLQILSARYLLGIRSIEQVGCSRGREQMSGAGGLEGLVPCCCPATAYCLLNRSRQGHTASGDSVLIVGNFPCSLIR